MSHVEPARLFALARGELGEAEAREVRSHVAECSACAKVLEDVVASQPMFAEPPVPELDEARWRAIDEKVLAAAAQEMQRKGLLDSLRALFDSSLFKPALALAAAAAAVALFFALGGGTKPVEIPVAIAPAVPAQHEALVDSAMDSASDDGKPLEPERRLAAGTVVATRKEGEAWLKLPDGSRLGVLAASRARLEEISPVSVKVALEEGGIAVTAEYAPQRQLEIVAGRLTVRAVGSKFLVMRDAQTSGVVVEEGVVEVGYDGKRETVAAGRSLSLSNAGVEGARLDEPDQKRVRDIVAPPVAAARPAPRVAMVLLPDASIEDEDSVDLEEPAPAAAGADAGAPAANPDEWAKMPPQLDAGARALAPPPVPVPPVVAAPAPAPREGEEGSWIVRKVKSLAERAKERYEDAHCRNVDRAIQKEAGKLDSAKHKQRLRALLTEQAKCELRSPDSGLR